MLSFSHWPNPCFAIFVVKPSKLPLPACVHILHYLSLSMCLCISRSGWGFLLSNYVPFYSPHNKLNWLTVMENELQETDRERA